MENECLVLLLFILSVYSWDPDAGYVPSWTKMPGVTVKATSGANHAANIIDNDDNTHWISGSCLPSGYVPRADENILLNACSNGHCSAECGSANDLVKMTDGNFYTLSNVNVNTNTTGQQKAKMMIHFPTPIDLHLLSIWGIYKTETELRVTYWNATTVVLKSLQHADNYKQITITKVLNNVKEILLESNSNFQLKEIASIGSEGCRERITVDLGTLREVGMVRTRHWAGSNSATALTMLFSADNIAFTHTVSLIPNALHAVNTDLSPARTVRYIQLEYQLFQKNYEKVYCWEIDAWDHLTLWGKPVIANTQKNTIRNILGVNGIWGWQHSKYSSLLNSNEGPNLYNAVASHARNYHNLDWDVTSPSKDPQYCEMENNHGTQAKSWLNWDTEYSAWRKANLVIDVSFQFTNKSFPQKVWQSPEIEAFNLGKHFASHFGAAHGNGLVDAVEIGNEPWDYEASFYNKILKGMSAGLKEIDPKIKILPGAFQAHDKHDTGNYIGTRVTQNLAVNISVVNFHTYSFRTNSHGVRIGTYPEHSDSSFNSIRNIVRWRDSNMPSKPIWVTEWGWDADGKGESCTFPECVSEAAQALYGIRGLLILARSNVQKVTWFFYANSQYCHTLFCRSGLTASTTHNFVKKNVFYAFEGILNLIGDKYFLGIYQENDNGYVYLFGLSHAHVTGSSMSRQQLLQHASHIVAWKPVDISEVSISTIRVQLGSAINHVSIHKFTGQFPAINKTNVSVNGTVLDIKMSAHPVVVELRPSNVGSGQIVG
ncbi:Hypothetical predicted protein [Mytilus galloprovincialis]|uniref:F5/8 type C domain-containing protein n=1 Tax=Mytilus galloprovincialis TaxID=29158 RepID=A0A8B6DN91_MYTGA|nr:Hypothetical predicted protein [Mytilus galloprovincialis]